MKLYAFVFLVLAGCAPLLKPTLSSSSEMMASMQRQMTAMHEAQAVCENEIKDELSEAELVAMSEERTRRFINNTGPEMKDAAVQKELERIAVKVAAHPVKTITLTQSEKVRSSFISDGTILLTTGLLKKTANEAQLAGVLAREAARIDQQADRAPHINTLRAQCQAQKMMEFLEQPASGGGTGFIHGPSETMLSELSPQEKEADLSVPEALSRAGYAPDAYEEFVRSLGDTSLGGVTAEGSGQRRAGALKARREELNLKNGKTPPLPKALQL